MFTAEKFLGMPWIVPAIISLIIAGIYYFIWPSDKVTENTNQIIWFILRYGHFLTWIFLAIASFAVYFMKENGMNQAKFIGLLGLFSYIIFMFTLLLNNKK